MILTSPPTLEQVRSLYDQSDRVLALQIPHAQLLNLTRANALAFFPPGPRRHAAMRERAQRERAADIVLCDARVVPNVLVRNGLSVFERLTSVQTYETVNVPTVGAALAAIYDITGFTPGCQPVPEALQDLVRHAPQSEGA